MSGSDLATIVSLCIGSAGLALSVWNAVRAHMKDRVNLRVSFCLDNEPLDEHQTVGICVVNKSSFSIQIIGVGVGRSKKSVKRREAHDWNDCRNTPFGGTIAGLHQEGFGDFGNGTGLPSPIDEHKECFPYARTACGKIVINKDQDLHSFLSANGAGR